MLQIARHYYVISSKVAVLFRQNDTEMGCANSLHDSRLNGIIKM